MQFMEMLIIKVSHCKKKDLILWLTYTQKKNLIESKKIICLKDFVWFEKMIYLN